jgi:hypothetical protein
VEASNIDAFHGQHNAPIAMEDQAGASTTNANPAAPPAAIPNVARCLVADKCGLTDGLNGYYSSCNDEGIYFAGCVVLPSTGDIIELLPLSFVAERVATLETAVAAAHLLIPPQLHECLQREQQQSFEDLTFFAAFEEEAAAQADVFDTLADRCEQDSVLAGTAIGDNDHFWRAVAHKPVCEELDRLQRQAS